jgi:hypothetical protein
LAILLLLPQVLFATEFSHKKYGLTLQMKEGWVRDASAPKSVLALFHAQDSIEQNRIFIPNFSIVVDNTDGKKVKSSCDYAAQFGPSLTKAGYENLVKDEETIGELDACSNTYVQVLRGEKKEPSSSEEGETPETVSLKYRQYYIFHKKLIYIFTLTAKDSEFEARVLDALQMLLTLRLA